MLSLCAILAGVGCTPGDPTEFALGDGGDYLNPELRAAVEQLQADVAATATDESTVADRAGVLADWADAYALAGGEVGLEGPRVRLQATLPPRGLAARRASANVDRLVREFALRDEPGALGALEAESLGPFEARSHATLRQTWTAGTQSILTGGGFWVARHFNANFGPFQTDDPTGEGYITIATSDVDATLTVDEIMASGPHGGFRAPQAAIVFRVTEGALDPGETVTITYGDTSGGGPGLRLPSTSSARMPLPLYVDLDGSREWRPLPIQPFVITGTTVAGVHGFAPSVVEPGETFELSVRAEDRFYNRATGPIPPFDVLVNGEVAASTPAGDEPITVLELSFPNPGARFITLRSQDGAISGEANPVLVAQDPERRIYWGETHAHSGQAEGIGTMEFFMRFARDDARLDFVTHSEHDVWLDAGEWEQMRETSAAFDDPGRFIPYLGWEWTRSRRQGGHHNVLFRTVGDQEFVSGLRFPTLSRLYQELHARFDPDEVLVIPHAHQPGDYRQSDPQLEPLIEMMSMHGTFEWFMRAYLSRGHQVGLIAASDDHLSHPGYSAPNRNSLAQRGGLAAVMAPERSRDAIFDAMKSRHTYATTGDRIILDMRVNDTAMGQRAPFAERRDVTGRVIGTAPLESIVLYKNDEALWEQDYLVDIDAGPSAELLLSFQSDATPYHVGDAPRGWRHWRGTLRVEGAQLETIAGTDFVNPSTQLLNHEGNTAQFATNTRGDTSSLRLTLSNVRPDAVIEIEFEEAMETGSGPPSDRVHQMIDAGQARLRLRDMRDGALEQPMPIEGYADGVSLRRIVTDGPRDVRFEYTDNDDPRQGDYYYARVRQANDAQAWSSPVWIGGYPSR
jgi:hypothetical protein